MPNLTDLVPYYAAAILVAALRSGDNPASFRLSAISQIELSAGTGKLTDDQLIELAIQQLVELGVAEFVEDSYGPAMLEVAHSALSVAAGELPDSAYDRTKRFGAVWLAEAIDNINKAAGINVEGLEADTDEPTDEDEWEPLPIDRSSPEFQSAIEESEAAVQAIEGSNGYAESEPEERNAIVHTIRGTLAALKEGSPSRAAIVEGLLRPLKYVGKKFSDASMGELAKKAVAALVSFLWGG